jgi:hypothetical protein
MLIKLGQKKPSTSQNNVISPIKLEETQLPPAIETVVIPEQTLPSVVPAPCLPPTEEKPTIVKKSKKSHLLTHKIVVNTQYGTFGVSKKAYEKLLGLNNKYALQYKKLSERFPKEYKDESSLCRNIPRDDEDLLKVILELGNKQTSGAWSLLRIISIPDGVQWRIEEYENREQVVVNDKEIYK